MPEHSSATPLERFEATLRAEPDPIAALRAGLVGHDARIDTTSGPRKLIYADYVASGRALKQIESFMLDEVLPFYANSHTESSFCGSFTTGLREAARATIARACGARAEDHAVIFSGSGATAGLNQLVHLLGVTEAIARGEPVRVFTGPYEHHSNILPWRESGAEVETIPEAAEGGPDLAVLEARLAQAAGTARLIVAMSAASNVTGILADVPATTALVKRHGATMVWDYAAGAPYLPMTMSPEGSEIDAIVFSAHKFIGGPGASGVLILRRDAVHSRRPYRSGGGTVAFVNDTRHDYLGDLEHREEGGTPNILGDIRAALVMIVKDVIGQDAITARNREMAARAFAAWSNDPHVGLLAPEHRDRLPIFSFVPRADLGIDPADFTRALSQTYGVQARGGCACAGPYAHHLLAIDPDRSAALRARILDGHDEEKPGFVRLNFSVLMTDNTVREILESVSSLARAWGAETPDHVMNREIAGAT
ncbi:aminotransferase class V-fold PLP-dependent enzyme [Maritimibacter sp. HL-12]|uniref:aminotransferase class V-fold PLP-dependent enzyme n=1 Tax=Maritimibacter sp. HL-12 TaxID=1162418 RepID=UPI000A0F184C|nr:aminotransferase class V-fold PLP-dependent enzyme [Maritimibacter sp. HL-12]SMH56298.1 Selenocysteine lyase/Cysteine desulfurase [Maritimibacter sp. HL-12]